jgi:2,4-dienoyl-CoA reductase-like NADH-dependent reductase (Old Yellow Enzyme family)
VALQFVPRFGKNTDGIGAKSVEVHGAHGYLVGQFLDGRRNHREDGYGGSLDDRARFLFEILQGIRSSTGSDFQVGVRLTPEGNGITVEEGREVTRRVLASQLVDYVDLSLWNVFMHPRAGGDRLLIDHFMDLPRFETRLGVTGTILTLHDAQWCLERSADFVSVGVGAILHHDWAARALTDPDFTVRRRPVPADHLTDERLSPTFINYLKQYWNDFVV